MTPHSNSPNHQAPSLLTMKIIWGALLASTIIYFGVLLQMKGDSASEPPPAVFFYGIAFVFFSLSFLLPKVLLKVMTRPQDLSSLHNIIQFYFAPFIIGMALAEAVCVVGFSLSFLQGNSHAYYPFWALSITRMMMLFPTEQKLLNLFPRSRRM